jgi:hypothetical protein
MVNNWTKVYRENHYLCAWRLRFFLLTLCPARRGKICKGT